MRTLLLSLAFSSLILNGLWAQVGQLSRKGRDLDAKASKAWELRDLEKAGTLYKQLADAEPGYGIAFLRLGQIHEWKKQSEQVRQYYEKAVSLMPASGEALPAYQWLARRAENEEDYALAAAYWEKILQLFQGQKTNNIVRLAERQLESAKFAQKAVQAPLDIDRTPLDDRVNHLQLQFFPVLTADNETLIFTGLDSGGDEDIYTARWENGSWSAPTSISETINTGANEGTCTISADGHTLVFTGCNRTDGFGSCDLYISYFKSGKWSRPENLGEPVNSRHWESQPSLSADGSVLYFASDRPGGLGKSDIWKVMREEGGDWTIPVNLGDRVNTPEDENAPFIHANGTTLFYASKGLPGMGGFDIFITDLSVESATRPLNLGYPINNSADQVGLFITADGRAAYYTEDRTESGKGRSSKLYTFAIPDTLKKLFAPTRYVKGRILDSESKQPVPARIRLYDLATQQLVAGFSSDETTGDYLAVVNSDSHYALYVESDGYLFKSMSFDITNTEISFIQDILIEKVRKDKAEVLSNVYFDTGDFSLSEKSKLELDKLVDFLVENKNLAVEISGHTDDVGATDANLKLSGKRAESVVSYLIGKGIGADRVRFKGYGEEKPKVPNDSDENRSINRRIEWRIL